MEGVPFDVQRLPVNGDQRQRDARGNSADIYYYKCTALSSKIVIDLFVFQEIFHDLHPSFPAEQCLFIILRHGGKGGKKVDGCRLTVDGESGYKFHVAGYRLRLKPKTGKRIKDCISKQRLTVGGETEDEK
jgi:hypothetical protein